MKKKLSYAIGDVVLYKGKERYITDTSIDEVGDMSYGLTHDGAWHDHSDLTFVRDADEDTIAKVVEELCEEFDEGEE